MYLSYLLFINYLLLIVTANQYDCESEYKKLLLKYGITHSEITEKTFMDNCKMVNAYNDKWLLKKDINVVKLKLNRFAFKTREEYKKNLKFRSSLSAKNQNSSKVIEKCLHSKHHVDWRMENAVPPVIDQGDCGSCWAFSAASVLGSMNYIKNERMVVYSPQELLDCVTENDGCDGGNYEDAYNYVWLNGINPENKYPYKGKNGLCQHLIPTSVTFHILDVCHTNYGDRDCLKSVVEKMGPISIAIDSTREDFEFYAEGIYSCSAGVKIVNHGMSLVGFYEGETEDSSYYILQNSHGKDWGLDGYMHLSMKEDEDCGIAQGSVYPLVTQNHCNPD